MNRKAFEDGMKLLAATWPDRAPSTQTMAAYWMALSDLSDDVWMEAVGRILRTARFFPAPAELRTAATEVLTSHGKLPDEPEPAWEAVLKAARTWTPYGPQPSFSDEAISRTVSELGGMGRIAMASDYEVTFIRKEFLSRYGIYRQRQIDSHPGVFGQLLAGDEESPAITGGEAA